MCLCICLSVDLRAPALLYFCTCLFSDLSVRLSVSFPSQGFFRTSSSRSRSSSSSGGAHYCYCSILAILAQASRRSASIPRLASPRVMRAFLQKASGEARDPSSVAQHADTFSSIAAVNRWLSVQGAACNTPDFQKLRAAVSVLRKTPNPRREEVSPLCSLPKLALEGSYSVYLRNRAV